MALFSPLQNFLPAQILSRNALFSSSSCDLIRSSPSTMDTLYLILIPLFLAGSILAFVAYNVAHRLESLLKSFPPNDLAFRLHQLEQKLAELQKIVNASSSPSDSPQPASPPPTAPSPQVLPPQPAPEAVRPPSAPAPREVPVPPLQPWPNLPPQPSHADLEALIGGRWFNRIGIIALHFAVSYFLKLAFDNIWIGPAGRVTIGILLGTLMLPWSQWLLSCGYTYFAEGIAGL